MKTLKLFFIVLAVIVISAIVPVHAERNTIVIPADQWRDTTSLVRSYTVTVTTTPVSIPIPTYTDTDNGNTISLTRNSVIKVRLNENPTTGFSWNISASPGIQVLSSSYLSSAPGRFGAGGTHTWVLKITGTGTQQFTGVYKQPWMPASRLDSTYKISFNVR